jgi:hypothetical protein
MAAPRKYPQEAEEAMYRLYCNGLMPAAIKARCAEGTAGLKPFDPPRKSVEAIVKRMERERGQRRRATAPERFDGDTDRQLGNRLRRVVECELERIESAQAVGKPVSARDLFELTRAHKNLVTTPPERPATGTRSAPSTNGNASKTEPSTLERLAAQVAADEANVEREQKQRDEAREKARHALEAERAKVASA